VLVLRQLVSYESAIPMALVVSGSKAPRLRALVDDGWLLDE
jgi:hypothetical protein